MERSPQAPQKPKVTPSPRIPSPAKPTPKSRTTARPRPTKPAVKSPAEPVATKQARLIALLRSVSGATMQQMMDLTGWQAHTVRGMLSGSLRKRLGMTVLQQAVQGVRVYRIVKGSAS